MAKKAYNNPYKVFFGALSNGKRFQIVMALKKPKNVSEICRELEMNQTTVSHNLQRLFESGFVFPKKEGKEKIYSLNKETILPLVKLIEKHTHCYCRGMCSCKKCNC